MVLPFLLSDEISRVSVLCKGGPRGSEDEKQMIMVIVGLNYHCTYSNCKLTSILPVFPKAQPSGDALSTQNKRDICAFNPGFALDKRLCVHHQHSLFHWTRLLSSGGSQLTKVSPSGQQSGRNLTRCG